MFKSLPVFLSALLGSAPLFCQAATYSQSSNVVGSGFLSAFSHQAISDPTHGRVNYVSQATAQSLNLTYASGNTFVIRADSTTKLTSGGPGRNSVRIQSNAQYTTHVVVFDIQHMPQGCGTWPAAWEVGDNWPNGGEVDIVEGVNDKSPNQATLHTSSGCTMPSTRSQTGATTGTNCDANVNGNAGCGVQPPSSKANNYGPAFNSAGGGWYAMERTNTYINVWFWSRNDTSVPADVKSGATKVNTNNWGTPFANFPNTNCDLASKFGPNRIVINLTLCGDWAGQSSIFNGDGCPGDCVSYVNNNPSAFANAYWQFNAMRVYQ